MGKSSKDKRDSYYRLAKEQGYRARSAFKLLQLNEQFNLFPTIDTANATTTTTTAPPPPKVRRIVDLCAAPGSWSQVLSRHLSPLSTPSEPITIIALDLQPMTPLPGVITLQADITHPSTLPLLLTHLRGSAPDHPSSSSSTPPLADLVLSDGAPDVTGLHDLDEYIQSQLLLSALTLAACVLRRGGTFVAKIFRGRDVGVLFVKLRCVFDKVTVAKPRSSRGSSVEAFVVCEGFFGAGALGPVGPGGEMDTWREKLEAPWEDDTRVIGMRRGKFGEVEIAGDGDEEGEGEGERDRDRDRDRDRGLSYIAPFIACGDLSAWDSDATYQLDETSFGKRESMDPVQKPTAPPYKSALEMKRVLAGEGKTKERGAGRKGKGGQGDKGKNKNKEEEERGAGAGAGACCGVIVEGGEKGGEEVLS